MIKSNSELSALMSKISDNPLSYFIQVGAGAGDRDSRAGYRDGFSEVIKSIYPRQNSRIILVEPNPLNIPSLEECWKHIEDVEILQLGVVKKNEEESILPLYYADLDAPHYQVASFSPQHVLNHYPQLDLEDLCRLEVRTISLESLLTNLKGDNYIIQLLALDIEGLDAEVLLDTDFGDHNIRFLSFETLHLGAKYLEVVSHLNRCGYYDCGLGVDPNGWDRLFQKQD